ncbi:MAG: heavy metal translocating P-type ATPase [Cyclobacteriaceae bacterium]|nr:heavy metal translocating P-type ATPase [Cyclobacteriaceae bacterium]
MKLIPTEKPTTIRQTFPVLEMTCGACAVSVESLLRKTDGIKKAAVNYANHTAVIEYDQKRIQPQVIQQAVRSIGYDLVIDMENAQSIQEEAQLNQYESLKRRTIWSSILSLPVFLIGMFWMDMPYGNYISMVLSAPVVFYFGRSYFVHAYKQATFGKANMDTLVALSTGIAFFFSMFNTFFPEFWHQRGIHPHVYYEAAAVVITFISLGKWLEEKAKSNTSSAIKKLMGLQPKTVHILRNGLEEEIATSQVMVGDIIIIRPGEKIPLDGIVVEGESFVDESMISGEPVANEKYKGEKVFAGTINQKGNFQFEAQKINSETVLAQIIKTVQQAQGSKAPVQLKADKIASVFVPVVMAISVCTFIIWMIVGGENAFTHALLTSVTVLVIACPCALGLATPTALMVGIGKGAENNILIKDAESLEQAHRISIIALDKTGTITEGKPTAMDIRWMTDSSIQHQAALYSLELKSEHPLAQAIVDYLNKSNASTAPITEFESITGMGAKAKVTGEIYFVGNKRLMVDNHIKFSTDVELLSLEWHTKALTVVYFSDLNKVLAMVAIEDKIKKSSKNAVAELQKMGIEVHLVTGDNAQTAEAVAKQVGIHHFQSQMLPADKAQYIERLQKSGKIVGMVGDGINDSQAMAQANVSMAMGKGSDIAMDTAAITLLTSDLQTIPKALMLSNRIVKGIHQNLFWAFIYNLIGIPLAAGILYPYNEFLLNPMIAGAAMALSSVSVVSNSLRLKWIRL